MPARNLIAGGAPAFPRFFIYIIGLILLLSAAVLALAAYAESLSGHYYYDSNVTSFLLFIVSPAVNLFGLNSPEPNRIDSQVGHG
ncbi:hypothetical protein SAMD00023353_0301080 [Rosellinia necatrix]|uniref:Uncharacterized protein n=1 Tax=Rosellinia necatrix TaxID=77044 RepID=A0A1W2TDC8_ROSNE|nr:hypothetical protein SAMD00023353_0301080 [Rosellinia necatrix]